MKIYLYLNTKILNFSLPQKVMGSFSFDENIDEESKLINIEAKNGVWHLNSTSDVKVIENNNIVENLQLEDGKFYILQKATSRYLIYVTNAFDNSFSSYQFDESTNLIIGATENCNIKYNCSLLGDSTAEISMSSDSILLSLGEYAIYKNNIRIIKNSNLNNNVNINNGDEIHIFGLKILILNKILFINNPSNNVLIDLAKTGLKKVVIPYGEEPKDFEVKDNDLYTKEQYFSKAPRMRRNITTKEINLSAPPRPDGEEQMPLILTIGPMLTMGLVSGIMLANNIVKITTGETTLQKSWPSLATSGAMILSMLLWPLLTKFFNKHIKKVRNKNLIEKYTKYLNTKKDELKEEQQLQKSILNENLVPIEDCLNRIYSANKFNFWSKRIDQNDFLEIRLGIGNELLDAKINYPEEGFTVEEDDLRKQADAMVEEFKYIHSVPIKYSLFKNKLTALLGNNHEYYCLIQNIILQLITFYSYDDLKIIVFTNKENEEKWEYIKYLNHSFSNDKSVRFFSTNRENAKTIIDYLNIELQNRIELSKEEPRLFKPYYLIITDDYSQVKSLNFIDLISEIDNNIGYSILIMENQVSKLPSKFNNFINLGSTPTLLKNSFDNQEIVNFQHELHYGINMMDIAKVVSNIPIEFDEEDSKLPDSISFLEMEKIGKVEQLNIMNRWDTNDSTISLKAEIGVDATGNLMYLDLHEKFHGPHGLIAGMTGSGKSEFIITYILSMAINYSPDDVAFILIDYKGGGLAGAFENKAIGITLPHLAGTITNLDKAEMDRTLVSIDSEIKRRQKIFNEARDSLGESTIDIYKYQRFYKEGKLTEPIPHLFIVCDEFAELKEQQPDFMDNLISVARIGRSLGVHLILATQKPSGVVNDQIWSNTKFRVCLKVQDASDSKEVLKRPEAASLKQLGRFYLQVGYDEYFALGQSAWCGAKYYPSEKIVKQVDKSINFIDETGSIIKSIQAGNNIKVEAQGEQIAAIMKNIIEVSKTAKKKAKRLWLNDIGPIILVDNLEKKYEFSPKPYNVEAIVGEYDAPEKQEQGLLVYSLKEDGNTIIYGNDEIERENLLDSIIYSICKSHSSNEINIYAVDYGSEQLRMFSRLPQFGGIIYMEDDEGIKNLFKLIQDELKTRKSLLLNYSNLENYNLKNDKKLPQVIFILNNYESILEVYNTIYEDIASIGRDCERYGIYLILTCSAPATVGRRVSQCFNNKYALHLADSSDYYGVFDMRSKIKPRDTLGRGLVNVDGIHEFQTSSIVPEESNLNEYLEKFTEKAKEVFKDNAKVIPTLPEKITFDIIEKEISTLEKVPIGISKDTLKTIKYDFKSSIATSITSNKLIYINCFMDSLLDILLRIPNLNIIFIDGNKQLLSANKEYNNKKINYYNDNLEKVVKSLTDFQKQNKTANILYIFYGLEKIKAKAESTNMEGLFNEIKSSENSNMILCDSTKNLKNLDMDLWYSKIKNNTDGIWIGKGFTEQQNFRIAKITKEMQQKYPNNYGFYISESNAELIKLIEFNDILSEENEEDE